MSFRAQSNTIYLGDNGRAYCGAHLGYTAKVSGHDLSGQALLAITPDILAEVQYRLACEQCGKVASRLWG